jgi:hypothetical protein
MKVDVILVKFGSSKLNSNSVTGMLNWVVGFYLFPFEHRFKPFLWFKSVLKREQINPSFDHSCV